MNAIQFIKEHGVDKAREVIDGAPDKTATHYVFRKIPRYYSVEFQSWYHDGEWWDSDCHTEQDLIDSYGSDFVLSLSDLKRLVESVDIINKFDSVQEAKDAISNAPEGATDYRKLSCTIRYIKQSERFFEYWDGSIWCRPAVPFTDETHILRFTELSRLKQAIADYDSIYGGEHV